MCTVIKINTILANFKNPRPSTTNDIDISQLPAGALTMTFFVYTEVASSNVGYELGYPIMVKSSQYISFENPLHKQTENARVCF